MSESTARAIRLTKAAGMREASEALRKNCYADPNSQWERYYNSAMSDAADMVLGLAEEIEAKS